MKQTISFEFETEREINLRDVFYTVDFYTKQPYYGICPACGGKGRVIINEREYRCPACGGAKNQTAGDVVLAVTKYAVKRWRVNKVTVGYEANEWKPAAENAVVFDCYRAKRGDRFGAEFRQIRVRKRIDGEARLEFSAEEKIYTNYEEAVRVANERNAASAAQVKEYNEKYGTTFTFENPVYDAKSK